MIFVTYQNAEKVAILYKVIVKDLENVAVRLDFMETLVANVYLFLDVKMGIVIQALSVCAKKGGMDCFAQTVSIKIPWPKCPGMIRLG